MTSKTIARVANISVTKTKTKIAAFQRKKSQLKQHQPSKAKSRKINLKLCTISFGQMSMEYLVQPYRKLTFFYTSAGKRQLDELR